MTKHILLVDDDALLRRSLSFNIEQTGYRVSTASNAEDALHMANRDVPDLVIMDVNLPGMDGFDALHEFRAQFRVPVILLTARRRELDEVLGLELGADDYVTKPFDTDVLLARIKTTFRHTQTTLAHAPEHAPVTVGDLQIDPLAHTVTVTGHPVDLSPREFDLLHTLALEAGHVVSTNDLLTRVWGAEYMGEPQVVYVHIRWLREKLEQDPNHPQRIVSVRRVGYRLNPQSATG